MLAKILLSIVLGFSSLSLAQSRDCAVKCVKSLVDKTSDLVPINGQAEFINLVAPAVGDTPAERVDYMRNLCKTRYGGNAVYDDITTAVDPDTKMRKIVKTASHEFKGTECQPKIQEQYKPLPVKFNPNDSDVHAAD